MKKEYWALLVFVLIIVLQWIGLGFHGQIRFIFLIIILVLIVLFADVGERGRFIRDIEIPFRTK